MRSGREAVARFVCICEIVSVVFLLQKNRFSQTKLVPQLSISSSFSYHLVLASGEITFNQSLWRINTQKENRCHPLTVYCLSSCKVELYEKNAWEMWDRVIEPEFHLKYSTPKIFPHPSLSHFSALTLITTWARGQDLIGGPHQNGALGKPLFPPPPKDNFKGKVLLNFFLM